METKEIKFKKLLKNLEESCIIEKYKYIGTGNPLSEILIIGKEASISDKQVHYKREILENFNDWKKIKNFNFEEIKERSHEYSPLYPYKGQELRKDNGKGNWGTSTTWLNYQKIINYVFNNPDNKKINFHENAFITEVNSTPSEKTANANTDSISYRKEHILASDFIQSFHVVIISGVGYFEISKDKNEIEQLFHVKFTERKNAGGNIKQPYWIHWNNDKTKIVINTYQLSIGIADVLLREIADEIIKTNLFK